MNVTDRQVAAELRRVLGVERADVTRGRGGNGQDTWFAAVDGDEHLVVRRSAGGSMTFTDRRNEYAVLEHLSLTDLPVPRVVCFVAAADSSLGADWFVMERLEGVPVGRLDPDVRRNVSRQIGELLASLHATGPWPWCRDVDRSVATQIELGRWWERWCKCSLQAPMLDALFGWLEHNRPRREGQAVALWGDAGPHNVLIVDGRVSAMLDWELAHCGDPLDDLAAGVWACFDLLDADEMITAWREASGEPLDQGELDYFVVMSCVTRSVISLLGVEGLLRRSTSTVNLAGLGLALTTANLQRAATLAWGEDDAVGATRPAGTGEWLRPTGPELAAIIDRVCAAGELDRRTLKICEALTATVPRLPDTTDDVTEWSATVHRAEVAASSEPPLEMRRALRADLAAQRRRLAPLLDLYGEVVV